MQVMEHHCELPCQNAKMVACLGLLVDDDGILCKSGRGPRTHTNFHVITPHCLLEGWALLLLLLRNTAINEGAAARDEKNAAG